VGLLGRGRNRLMRTRAVCTSEHRHVVEFLGLVERRIHIEQKTGSQSRQSLSARDAVGLVGPRI
jgi:hypothetical protein